MFMEQLLVTIMASCDAEFLFNIAFVSRYTVIEVANRIATLTCSDNTNDVSACIEYIRYHYNLAKCHDCDWIHLRKLCPKSTLCHGHCRHHHYENGNRGFCNKFEYCSSCFECVDNEDVYNLEADIHDRYICHECLYKCAKCRISSEHEMSYFEFGYRQKTVGGYRFREIAALCDDCYDIQTRYLDYDVVDVVAGPLFNISY